MRDRGESREPRDVAAEQIDARGEAPAPSGGRIRRGGRPRCVFCEIIAGRAPASRVYEDACTLAFMDTNPVAPGHLLVIPKAHRAQIWEMAGAEFAGVSRCLPDLVRALKSAMAADAVNVLSLNGPAGGQTVFHLHLHLIPVHQGQAVLRRAGRRIALRFVQRRASRAELRRVSERIRAHLPARGYASARGSRSSRPK